MRGVHMNLLLIDSNPDWGGGQKWCLDTALGLRARGAHVTIACLAGSPLCERSRSAGLPVIRAGGLLAGLQLARWARRERPEVAIATLGRDVRAGALVKLACSARLVQRRGIARPVGNGFAQRRVDRFVANSEAIAAALGSERVELILNAVEPAPALARADARARLGLSADEELVLAIGRLAPMKGHELLLEAWREVERERPHARLWIAGSGEQADLLERAAAPLERVRLLGFREDTAVLLAAADLYVQPSVRDEGTSHALLEALAAGTPALVSAVAGLAETVRRCGGGRVHEVGDAGALARGIVELLGAPAELERLGRAGRAGVALHHAPALILERWERFLGGLARWRTPPAAATTSGEARR